MCAGVCRSYATVVTRNSHAADVAYIGSDFSPHRHDPLRFAAYARLGDILLHVWPPLSCGELCISAGHRGDR